MITDTYFRGGKGNDWITPDKSFASEYGEVSEYKLSPNAKLLDAQTSCADDIASRFLGEPVEDSLATTDLWYQPDKRFSDFLRKEGYDGFVNDKNIFIANKDILLKE
mgnify:FL=1